jgi:hypothetical protein
LHKVKAKEIQVTKPAARNAIDVTDLVEKGEAKLVSGAATKQRQNQGLLRNNPRVQYTASRFPSSLLTELSLLGL